MAKCEVFEQNALVYDAWFDENRALYLGELAMVRSLMPEHGQGLEIGAGTGRFAAPLGLAAGVEPSRAMAAMARRRGLRVVEAVAEALPFAGNVFDFALMITAVCFLDDIGKAFREAHRILKPDGALIIAFIERESQLGKKYGAQIGRAGFFREAALYSAPELEVCLEQAGFAGFVYRRMLISGKAGDSGVKEGHDRGDFIIVRATRKQESHV